MTIPYQEAPCLENMDANGASKLKLYLIEDPILTGTALENMDRQLQLVHRVKCCNNLSSCSRTE